MEDHESQADELASGELPRPLGGVLCLDFVNTVHSRGASPPHNYLRHYADLVRWSLHVGSLDESQARHLLLLGERRPAEAAHTFAAALALRETLDRVFGAVAHGETPASGDLDALRAAHCAALHHARLVPAADGYVWEWAEADALDRVIWLVIQSAIELLLSQEVARVRECANAAGCGWLFLDRSKNGSRRWCSMDECGSRDKMRRQYARRLRDRGMSQDIDAARTDPEADPCIARS